MINASNTYEYATLEMNEALVLEMGCDCQLS